jgi:hypothetical protein
MPWTEIGPAACRRRKEDDPVIEPLLRRWAEEINFLARPLCKGDPVIDDPALDIARSNLKHGQSVFGGKPRFDRNRFKTGQRVGFTDHRIADSSANTSLTKNLKALPTSSGALLSATWEGALAGSNVSAKVTARVGTTKGYEQLLAAAQPTREQFLAEMAKPFYLRWKWAEFSYWDKRRLAGKPAWHADVTHAHAAALSAERSLYEYLRAFGILLEREPPNGSRKRKRPKCFPEKHNEGTFEIASPVLGFFLLWFLAAEIPAQAYWKAGLLRQADEPDGWSEILSFFLLPPSKKNRRYYSGGTLLLRPKSQRDIRRQGHRH